MRTGKKYFKDGNPEVYGFFNDTTWKKLTDREKAMWTPYSEVDHAPIPEEVLEFSRSREETDDKDTRIAELEAKLAKVEVEPKEEPSEEEKKKALIAELKGKGLKASMNYKLETLEKKLQDADNSE